MFLSQRDGRDKEGVWCTRHFNLLSSKCHSKKRRRRKTERYVRSKLWVLKKASDRVSEPRETGETRRDCVVLKISTYCLLNVTVRSGGWEKRRGTEEASCGYEKTQRIVFLSQRDGRGKEGLC